MPQDRRSVLNYVFWVPLAMFWSCFLLCYAIHIRCGRRRTGIASRSERYEEAATTCNKKEKQNRRRQALLEIFQEQHICKTLSMDDFFIPKTLTDPPAVVDAVTSQLTIAVDLENGRGTMVGTDEDDAATTTTRMIKLPEWNTAAHNGCVICFCEYQPGDVLVWSSNRSSCRHVYHQECLLDYFLTKGRGGADDGHNSVKTIPPCPMCRQAFIVHKTKIKEGTAMGMSSLQSAN